MINNKDIFFEEKKLVSHEDERGFLFEAIRFQDDNIPVNGQLYMFTINPNKRRGDHYHKIKKEWFTCVYGSCELLLRSKKDEYKVLKMNYNDPKIIYVPPYTVHALINRDSNTCSVISYSSTQHDKNNPDTYFKSASK